MESGLEYGKDQPGSYMPERFLRLEGGEATWVWNHDPNDDGKCVVDLRNMNLSNVQI